MICSYNYGRSRLLKASYAVFALIASVPAMEYWSGGIME
jgi:hypothetical protein